MSRALTAFWRTLVRAFTENLGLKSLSLAAALALVAYTRGQLDETQRTIPVGVVLRLPPDEAKRELMTPIPANIHVTVVGPTRGIDQLIQTGIAPVEVDLRDGRSSSIVFDRSLFSVPGDIEIKIIDPPSLPLDWQDVVVRTIPVQASRTGQPAKGYEVKDHLDVEPTRVDVRGPQSLVEVMQFARLAAFDVTGLTDGVYRRRLAIDPPPARVKYVGPAAATVTATVIRRQTDAKFPRVKVEILGLRGARSTPPHVDVTVTGSPEVIAALRPDQLVPTVDLSGVDLKQDRHGTRRLEVAVDLAGASAEIQPPTVVVTW
jgi:hypothetical protein